MNLGMECDIRVKMVEKETSKGMPARCSTLSRTCSLWALAEHDRNASKMWCNRNVHIIGEDPEWKLSIKEFALESRLRLFQLSITESL